VKYARIILTKERIEDVSHLDRHQAAEVLSFAIRDDLLDEGLTVDDGDLLNAVFALIGDIGNKDQAYCDITYDEDYVKPKEEPEVVPRKFEDIERDPTSVAGGKVVEYNRGYCVIDKHNAQRKEAAKLFRWAEDVKHRDGGMCQRRNCYSTQNLNAHHKDNKRDYPIKRFDVNNGVTLCRSCHIEFHRKFGYCGTNSEQTALFLDSTL